LDSDSSSTTLSTGATSENQRANAGPDQNLQTSRSSSGRCATFTSRRRGPSTGSDHCSAIISVAHVLLTSCPAVVVVARVRLDLPVAHVLLTSCPAVVVVARVRLDLPVAHVLLTSCPAVVVVARVRLDLPVAHVAAHLLSCPSCPACSGTAHISQFRIPLTSNHSPWAAKHP